MRSGRRCQRSSKTSSSARGLRARVRCPHHDGAPAPPRSLPSPVAAVRDLYGGPFVLTVGRLVAYKGFDRLIRIARGLSWDVVIVGEGPLRVELESQIRKLDLTHRVHLAGQLDDQGLRTHFAAAD